MSNNNLYDILKNFASLTPKAEAPKPAAEKIYESVNPRGSVSEGIANIESRLAKQFAESDFSKMSAGIQKSGKSKASADAITAAVGREKLGQREMTRRAVAGKKHAHEDMAEAGQRGGLAGEPDMEEGVAENTSSISDKEIADLIHDIAVHLIFNKQKMSINEANPKLVATEVQKAYKMEGIPFGQSDLTRVQHIFPKVMRRLRKGFAPEVKDSEDIDEQGVAEGEGPRWYVRQEIQTGDPDRVAGPFPNQQQANMWIKSNVPPKDYEMYDTMEESMTEGKEECPDCECTPCECSTNEGYVHKGTAYGGAAQKDDEDEEDDDKPKSKKLGAPKKKDSERSSASLPFGGKSDTGKHKLPAHKGATTRHSMSDEPPKGTPERAEWEEKKARRDKADARKKKKVKESMSRLESRFRELLGEGRMIDESGETLQHILNRFKHEVKNFEAGGDIGDKQDFFDALFDYYCDNGEMPYGTAKARTGDPYDWITDRLARELRTNEAAPAVPGTVPTGLGGLGAVPQTVKPQQTGPLATVKDTVKGMMGHDDVDHWTMTKPQDESMEPTMEAELNELARLAGLKIADEGNAFTGKLAHTEKGGKFDLDGKTYTDTSTLDEGHCPTCDCKPCECNEGNAFGKAVRDAKADGIQPGEKVKVGGHEYPVKESTTLEDIAKLSGIAVEGRDYGDTKIAEPAEFANTPEPEVMPANVMLKGGDGEVAGKEKKMSKNGAARFSDNPMESADPLESLGRRLMQAYNSIKIQK